MNRPNSTKGYSLTMEEMLTYLDGRCSPEELERIKTLIDQNPLYQAAIEELEQSLQEDESQRQTLLHLEKRVDSKIEAIADEVYAKSSKNDWLAKITHLFKTQPVWRNGAAASVVLLISVGILLYSVFAPTRLVRIARTNLTHFEDPLAQLGGDDNLALFHYSNHNYQKAIPYLEKTVHQLSSEGNPQINRFRMLLGVSLLHESRTSEALPHFQKIIDHNDNLYVIPAQWYLAIGYLALSDKDSAFIWLKKLENSPQQDRASLEYIQRARDLLKRLE